MGAKKPVGTFEMLNNIQTQTVSSFPKQTELKYRFGCITTCAKRGRRRKRSPQNETEQGKFTEIKLKPHQNLRNISI